MLICSDDYQKVLFIQESHLYREGLIHARRIRRTGYLSMRLSHYWRMLSKDNSQSWKSMSYATYDTQIAI
ncbi:hypothetical protein [Symbiopectobacterium sp. RP]|uniref:ParE family toxin-like protein n=1 Tax=Symbiopectobacterium sp. RP TaxID=3248553 RepID=UPI003D276576